MIRPILLTLAVSVVSAALAASSLAGVRGQATEKFTFDAVFHVTWQAKPCPKSTPAGTVACDHTAGSGLVASVGHASERYDMVVLAPSKKCTQWRFTSLVTVPHKGTLQLAVKSTPCVDPSELNANGTFVVHGGTGIYANASGHGSWAGTDGKVTGKERGTATDFFHGTVSLAD